MEDRRPTRLSNRSEALAYALHDPLFLNFAPALADVLADPDRRYLRCWLPQCGAGELAYRVAALLADHPRVRSGEVETLVFGTDADPRNIRSARGGVVPVSALRGDVGAYRHFRACADGLRASDALRHMCIFATHDLLHDPPLQNIDLVWAPWFNGSGDCADGSDDRELVQRLFLFAAQPSGIVVTSPCPRGDALNSRFDALTDDGDVWSVLETERDWRLATDFGIYRPRRAPISSDLSPAEQVRSLTETSETLQVLLEELHAAQQEQWFIAQQLRYTNEELVSQSRELRRANADLETVWSSIEIPTMLVARDLLIRRFTPATKSVYRVSEGDVGRPLTDIAARFEPPIAHEINAAIEEGVRRECRVESIGRNDRIYRVAIAPYRTNDDVDGAILTFLDITDTERARIEESRQKDDFLALLGHELRNPLNALQSGSALLAQTQEPEAVRRVQKMMERQTRQMQRLLDTLLDISTIAHGKTRIELRPIELRDLVLSCVDDHRAAAERIGIELQFVATKDRRWVDADEMRLTQIINNLLTNAIKSTPSGGWVEVTVCARGKDAVVEVTDTGIGIGRDLIPIIFEPFRQAQRSDDTTRGSLGLGLALARGLAELHGGALECQSDGPGTGSTFTLRLPARDTPEPRDHPVAAVGSMFDILVIEDSTDAGDLLCSLLQSLGHTVRWAKTGRDGLELASHTRPDVILCDIGLPDVSGHDVARQLREDTDNESIVILALSGYARETDLRRSREAGFDAHLTKPVELQRLLRLIADLA